MKIRTIRFIFSMLIALVFSFGTVVTIYAKNEKLPAPDGVKALGRDTSIILTWNRVEGAYAYKVSMYSDSTKSYQKYKTVTGNRCIVTGLEQGKTYKFEITTIVKKNGKAVAQGSAKISAKAIGNTLVNKKKPSKWNPEAAKPGSNIETFMKSSGIANWEEVDPIKYAPNSYIGEVLIEEKTCTVLVSFNEQKRLYAYWLYIPADYARYSEDLEDYTQSLGYDYSLDFSDSGNLRYIWVKKSFMLTLEYDSTEGEIATLIYYNKYAPKE